MAIIVIQGSPNRSRVADVLLTQLTLERGADVVMLSEQYCDRDRSSWFADDLDIAALCIRNPARIWMDSHGAGRGFV